MKINIVLFVLSLVALTTLGEDRVLSNGWQFSLDGSSWSEVQVPHDWAIAGPFDAASKDGDTGKLPWRGVGTYRRQFVVSERDAAGTVVLDFDGVMARPKVFVNGKLAGGWDYGYQSFRVDATPFVVPGTNLLKVVADTRSHRSRWYPGAGINRKVVLKTLPKAHFAYNGIAVTTPVAEKDHAVVRVRWETTNANDDAEVKVRLLLGDVEKASRIVPAKEEAVFELKDPQLWDVDSPRLYVAECTLSSGGETTTETVRFGIRKIEFPVGAGADADVWEKNGFHLNGRRVQLKGVNLHEDMGLLGRAYSRSAVRRQLLLMKDMGANALRTSHNPVAPETLDLCDELGILVWDECFDKWDDTASRLPEEPLEPYVERNLRAFVRRDRNHPSVIVWSMGNEIGGVAGDRKDFTHDPSGMTRERCARFRRAMLEEDATRPVGNGNMPHVAKDEFFDMGIWDDLDVTGWNYLGSHEKAKAKYPAKPVVYSESASAGSTYGFYSGSSVRPYGYRTGAEFAAKQMDGYDLGTTIDIADLEFDRMERSPWCAGEFVWTGVDYLGEPIPFREDARSSYFGIVDLTGVPKDRYWLYRSHWNEKDETVHILPHWNHPSLGTNNYALGTNNYALGTTPIFVYTSGDAAELFINGRSQGMRRKGACDLPGGRTNACYKVCGKYRLMWFDTVYEPGEVKAVAYKNGKRIGESVVRTAGEPVALKLTQDYCDGEMCFVQIDAVDADGVRNPLAANRVALSVSGPGRIVAVGNGNPRAYESFADPSAHSLFFGKAVAVVRREGAGRIVLSASADSLVSAETELGASAVVSQPCGAGELQGAVDRVSAAGGGTVHVERGDYPVAFLELKSGVTLDLAEGARLYAETNALIAGAKRDAHEHKQDNAMILSRGAKNVAIVGKGEIDGLGGTFRPTSNNLPGRWKLVVLQDTEGIRIEGVTLRDSASWTCYFQRCRGIVVRGVKVDGHANYNNDGFDIEASDVLIEDCDIDCEDDAICGKVHDASFVSENVEVRNCRLASNCNFIKLGTASYGTFRNWRVHDCVLERCRAAPLEELQWFRRGVWGVTDRVSGIAGICLEAVDGGRIEDVEVRDIEMRSGVQTPIFMRVGARHGEGGEWNFRNVTIERVKGRSCSWIASSITGVPGRRIGGGIVLRDIDLVLKGGISGVDWNATVPEKEKSYPENRCFGTPLPAYGFYLRHADGVKFENVRLSCVGGAESRPPVVTDDCTDVDFAGGLVERTFPPERHSRGDTNVRMQQPIDEASWIWAKGSDVWGGAVFSETRTTPEVLAKMPQSFFRFRRDFEATEEPLELDVSADERFVLLLDGKEIARGPMRGLPNRWNYQSYRLTGLKPGTHRLEAVCWQVGEHAPLAQVSVRGGFIVKAGGAYDEQLTTGKAAWRVAPLSGTRMTHKGKSGAFGVGSQCEVSGTGLLDEEPDAGAWSEAVVVRGPVKTWAGLVVQGWKLFPSPLRDMMHELKTPGSVKRGFGALEKGRVVPANSKVAAWWDLGDYYCAYPVLSVSGGKGARVSWDWAECLTGPDGKKGDRAAFEGLDMPRPFGDVFLCDGRSGARFTTPWWRCGRWCRLTVETADEPLMLDGVEIAETRYPVEMSASFDCDDPFVMRMQPVCARSLKMCMHEMFFDCPYYEQQMYPGDSRVQYLVSGLFDTEDRMVRNAINLYDADRRENGQIPMNCPTRGIQDALGFTCCEAMMFGDYAWNHANRDWLKAKLPGLNHTLMGMDEFAREDGLLRKTPGWNFVDWVSPPWKFGVPPDGDGESPNAEMNLQYLHAMLSAAIAEDAVGDAALAAYWRGRAEKLKSAIKAAFWCEEKALFASNVGKTEFSEHSQCLALLADVVTGDEAARCFKALVETPKLARGTIYYKHYLYATYFKFHRADLFFGNLGFWRNCLDWHLSTILETPGIDSRSDCHGWGSHPLWHLHTGVAGVRSAAPFYEKVLVEPQPAHLKRIRSSTPTPKGDVALDLVFDGGRASGTVTLPSGLSGTFRWNGRDTPLLPGVNEVR